MVADRRRLEGKAALVTGAGGDIGRAVASAFVQHGARVACLDVDLDAAQRCAQEAGVGAPEGAALACACDVADAASVRDAVAFVLQQFTGIDVLVNNAAAASSYKPVHLLSETEWREAMDVNLTGAFLMSKAVVPAMLEGGGGSIIHMASQMGHVGNKGRGAYGTTKAALIHLARIMALDYGEQKIRVNSLSPGAVMTSRLVRRYGSTDAVRERLEPFYPLGRLGTPEDVAAAAVFLASDESSFVTGTDLLVDGGYTAQ